MFNFNDKVVIVTGGAQGIGKCIAEVFKKEGAKVTIIDIKENEYFIGDIGDKNTLERFANKVITDYGKVDFLINNAAPKMCGISNGTYEDFEYSLRVGVTAPFYLAKLLAPYFNDGASIVNISSSRDRMSQPETESYTAAKGGISALTHALSVSFAGKVRVNAISPGWIENSGIVYEGADAIQQPAGRVGNSLDIANMVLYLCSEMSGFITGENICIKRASENVFAGLNAGILCSGIIKVVFFEIFRAVFWALFLTMKLPKPRKYTFSSLASEFLTTSMNASTVIRTFCLSIPVFFEISFTISAFVMILITCYLCLYYVFFFRNANIIFYYYTGKFLI